MTNRQIEAPPKIPVTPKLIYTSKSFLGAAITAISILASSLGQQSWIDPGLAKALSGIGQVCGVALTIIGSVDRPELFFRPGKLQEAVQGVAKELTLEEAVQSGLQFKKALENPSDIGGWAQFATDTQQRLTAQDQVLAQQNGVLANIETAVTANQFPPMADYPDRTDLPRDPRQMAQREAPPVQWEPDVTTANSEGVLEGY